MSNRPPASQPAASQPAASQPATKASQPASQPRHASKPACWPGKQYILTTNQASGQGQPARRASSPRARVAGASKFEDLLIAFSEDFHKIFIGRVAFMSNRPPASQPASGHQGKPASEPANQGTPASQLAGKASNTPSPPTKPAASQPSSQLVGPAS